MTLQLFLSILLLATSCFCFNTARAAAKQEVLTLDDEDIKILEADLLSLASKITTYNERYSGTAICRTSEARILEEFEACVIAHSQELLIWQEFFTPEDTLSFDASTTKQFHLILILANIIPQLIANLNNCAEFIENAKGASNIPQRVMRCCWLLMQLRQFNKILAEKITETDRGMHFFIKAIQAGHPLLSHCEELIVQIIFIKKETPPHLLRLRDAIVEGCSTNPLMVKDHESILAPLTIITHLLTKKTEPEPRPTFKFHDNVTVCQSPRLSPTSDCSSSSFK